MESAHQAVENLMKAIKRNPKSSLFRMNWGISGTLASAGGDALYDKSSGILRLYTTSSTRVDDDEKGTSHLQRAVQRYHLSKVTPAKLNQTRDFLRKHPSINNTAGFSELEKLGCPMKIVENRAWVEIAREGKWIRRDVKIQ